MYDFCFVDVELSEQEAGKGAREGAGGVLSWDKSEAQVPHLLVPGLFSPAVVYSPSPRSF